jgi:hypothetical protein
MSQPKKPAKTERDDLPRPPPPVPVGARSCDFTQPLARLAERLA